METKNLSSCALLVLLTVAICATGVLAQDACDPCPTKCPEPLNLCPPMVPGSTQSAYCGPCDPCPQGSKCCNICDIPAMLDLNYKSGEGDSMGWLGLMIPVMKDPEGMVYADFKTFYSDDDVFSQSFGGGYRKYLRNACDCAADVIWGVYGYYDRIKTEDDNYFKQGVFGAELLGCNWQIWGNYYLPQRSKEFVSATTVGLTTTSIYEYGLPGYEIMGGYAFDICEKDRLWFYGGYYDFDRSGLASFDGPKFAVEYEHFDPFGMTGHTLTFGVEVTDDDLRGTDTMYTVNWLMPLGCEPAYNPCCNRTLECRMREATRRDFYGTNIIKKAEPEIPSP